MSIEILVVDDDQFILDCVSQQLAHAGYIAHNALSGTEAVECLKALGVDMVITDYQMENMNGIQLRDHIRSNGNDQIPIILMTADRDQKLRAGFDGFLQKPFSMKELLSEVDKVLASH